MCAEWRDRQRRHDVASDFAEEGGRGVILVVGGVRGAGAVCVAFGLWAVVRNYTIWGKESLTDAAWHFPTNAADRFFKVSVEMP